MRNIYAVLAIVAATGFMVGEAAGATFVVASDGPVIAHMCGLKSDPTACHWCSEKTGTCYVVNECHNGKCTIITYAQHAGTGAAPNKVGKPVQAH